MKFGVMVTRTETGHKLIEVDAENAEEAIDKALEMAGDYEFTSHDAVYDAESVSEIEGPEPEHDPETCGCRYLGNDMWSCGHIDNEDVT